MSRTSDIEHLNVFSSFCMPRNQCSGVSVREIKSSTGTPVSKQAGFDIILGEWLFKKCIGLEEDLSSREVVGNTLESEDAFNVVLLGFDERYDIKLYGE